MASGNGEDVYNDASSLTATIQSASGGNFENLVIGANASATAHVNDTITDATANLSASTVLENPPHTSYVFTATLSNASHGDTTIVTDTANIVSGVGTTSLPDALPICNGEDVYNDASSLTATIQSASGGNFENLVIGANASATAHVND